MWTVVKPGVCSENIIRLMGPRHGYLALLKCSMTHFKNLNSVTLLGHLQAEPDARKRRKSFSAIFRWRNRNQNLFKNIFD